MISFTCSLARSPTHYSTACHNNTAGRRSLTLWSLLGVTLSLVVLGLSFTAIAASSPLVTRRGTSTGRCGEVSDCFACLTGPQCGYCGNATVGTCLPRNSSGGSIVCSPQSWDTGVCPEARGSDLYGKFALVGLFVYIASFAPGMVHTFTHTYISLY